MVYVQQRVGHQKITIYILPISYIFSYQHRVAFYQHLVGRQSYVSALLLN